MNKPAMVHPYYGMLPAKKGMKIYATTWADIKENYAE